MELTPKERERIYLEEKARREQQISKPTRHRITPGKVILSLIVFSLGATYISLRLRSHTPADAEVRASNVDVRASQEKMRADYKSNPARQYMRGLGFTTSATDRAMKAAAKVASTDSELVSAFDVLQRMAHIALTGFVDEQALRSVGTDDAAVRKAMGRNNFSAHEAFPSFDEDLRIRILSSAMDP